MKYIITEEQLKMIMGGKTLYHGGHNLEGKDIVLPMFLTPIKHIAEWYGYQRGGWVNEFHMDIDKPLDSVKDWKLVLEDIGIDWEEFNGDMVWQLNRKDLDRENWSRRWSELGGDILDIIYYKPFRGSMKKFGYDVIIWEDAGSQDTTGLVYVPLYKDKIHFVSSTPLNVGGFLFPRTRPPHFKIVLIYRKKIFGKILVFI